MQPPIRQMQHPNPKMQHPGDLRAIVSILVPNMRRSRVRSAQSREAFRGLPVFRAAPLLLLIPSKSEGFEGGKETQGELVFRSGEIYGISAFQLYRGVLFARQ